VDPEEHSDMYLLLKEALPEPLFLLALTSLLQTGGRTAALILIGRIKAPVEQPVYSLISISFYVAPEEPSDMYLLLKEAPPEPLFLLALTSLLQTGGRAAACFLSFNILLELFIIR
jgi:hypothetical protein